MELYASATSPFVRKVRVALLELGLADSVTIRATNALEDPTLRALNPLGKVPALRLADGTVLYDSRVIVEYLDHLEGSHRLLPAEPAARLGELRRHALADGVLDAAFNLAIEARRPPAEQSAFWKDRWTATVALGAGVLAGELAAEPTDAPFGLAAITAAVAADYVAFRHPAIAIDALSQWREKHAARASLLTTHPSLQLEPA